MQTERQRKSKLLSTPDTHNEWAEVKAGSQELNPVFSHGWQGHKHFSHHPGFPGPAQASNRSQEPEQILDTSL